MTVPFNATTPRYHQIARLILQRAQSGDAAARVLPSEMALCAEFGVSRTTIRQALDVLKQQRLLESRRGVGTRFVGTPAQPKRVGSSGDPLHGDLGSQVRILSTGSVPAPAEIARFFDLAPGAPVFRIRRVHALESAPLSVVVSYLPAALAPILTRAALRKPVHEVLWERSGILQHRSEHIVRVARADAQVAALLKVGLTDPVLYVQSSVYLADGAPIRWTENFFREDRYQYLAEVMWEKPAEAARPPRRRKP